jgi:hypothetical protein
MKNTKRVIALNLYLVFNIALDNEDLLLTAVAGHTTLEVMSMHIYAGPTYTQFVSNVVCEKLTAIMLIL